MVPEELTATDSLTISRSDANRAHEIITELEAACWGKDMKTDTNKRFAELRKLIPDPDQ